MNIMNNEHYDIAFKNYNITNKLYNLCESLQTYTQSDCRDFPFNILVYNNTVLNTITQVLIYQGQM